MLMLADLLGPTLLAQTPLAQSLSPSSMLALSEPLASSDPLILLSVWKPLVLMIPFVLWARIVSAVLDKHAAQFFLPRRTWNAAHLIAALLALVAGLALGTLVGGEGGFFAGFAVAVLILAADIAVYVLKANKDERVTEGGKLTFIRLFGSGKGPAKKKDAKQKKNASATQLHYTIRQTDEKGKFTVLVPAPAPETPELELRGAAESMLTKALAARASQLEIGPGKDQQYQARWMVDGVYQNGDSMPAQNALKLMDFWKGAAKLEVAERRKKQVGDVLVEDSVAKRVLRVTSIGAQGGARLTLLVDPERAVTRKPADLGLLDVQMTELQAIVAERKGVVLLCSPPDGGRTTLLYSVLKMHDAYISNVQTVEIEPQAAVEGVRTNRWDPAGVGADGTPGAEFSTLVRSILRRDPDVVGVGDLPDQATAKEVAKAEHERTRTYVSLKAGDPFVAIQTWLKAVGDTRQAADALHGVVVVKLARKLCTNCRVEYPPSAEMLKKLGVPEGKSIKLFKKGGQVLIKNKPETCPVCAGLGFYGQEGVFEVYSITKDERDLIAQGNLPSLKAAWRKRSLPTLQQVAIRKAVDGTTSVEEVTRITASEAPTPAAVEA